MKSLPKRFGFADLAIESGESQEARELIDLIIGGAGSKSAPQHAFFGGETAISVSNPAAARLWSLRYGRILDGVWADSI
ncbi:hypothetical protein [Mesorhizobium sp. SARCC-RB16n]|uniref:hypothetical protein n=1 Tax=Mesorhizobium sp. SARCC-RB16n TaxID=2116687 RepID=UPI00122ECDA2|nr:hypothetical protein [Mesorhizobium sp. SARCC-RB16n]